ncbi:GNAT family N-acetyltransferase [Leptolyngbya sp. 7M]|uniref:GNAT family N-acetyltransferase n=1 Tax=Leptolyngbya sp. 7M TaxID=2812896 RepID=UPI001B8C4616|nr:GNAT family N-acetyltransferase [Leptolyngbya sp. 7M]QYO63872.1 GNAT family N-acetyltransferase [Leptolyngbya sp. 7M]
MSSSLPVDCVAMSLTDHPPKPVANLIYQSAPAMFGLMFGGKAIPILTDLVQHSQNRFSHRYVRVAEASITGGQGNQILGVATLIAAESLNQTTDYQTCLNRWQQLRLQFVDALILNRLVRHDYPPGTFYIANLAVDSAYRGQGIGTQLLQYCIAEAATAKASHVYISVDIDNPRAQNLYESLGFQVIETKTLRLSQSVGSRVLALSLDSL